MRRTVGLIREGKYYSIADGEVPPPLPKKFGEAPAFISDSMDAYYHPAAECFVDSKSQLRQIDKVCGTVTTDRKLTPDGSAQKKRQKERHDDLHKCMHRAVAQIDAGTAPLTEQQRALCERQNEITSSALNFDAFNVAGRKDNEKGKKYRR